MQTKKNKSKSRLKPQCILVPVDFSESSLTALDHALLLAQQNQSQLILLHVIEPFSPSILANTAELQRDIKAIAHKRLITLADATKKIWSRTGRELRSGHPVATILALAKRVNADLIVMGTHGRTGFRRTLIGSVAERVVRLAPCSVLIVR